MTQPLKAGLHDTPYIGIAHVSIKKDGGFIPTPQEENTDDCAADLVAGGRVTGVVPPPPLPPVIDRV